jgi:MFS family permease
MLLIGGAILILFSLVNGFCTKYESFVATRALTGVGGGLIMPNAVAMITIMLPPGQSRNITMGFFAASAPIGSWLGALFSGLFIQLSKWEYLFFFTCVLAFPAFVLFNPLC